MIGAQCARSHQHGQLAGATSAHQIHLKEAILGVDKTEGQGDIGALIAPDGRHPQRVPFDDNRVR